MRTGLLLYLVTGIYKVLSLDVDGRYVSRLVYVYIFIQTDLKRIHPLLISF